MGFLDKAKQLAEQAQHKLDEVQGQFNASQQRRTGAGPEGAPPVEYDAHGRPIRSAQEPASPEIPVPPGEPEAPAAPAAPPSGSEPPERRRDDDATPPPLTSGDPLAG